MIMALNPGEIKAVKHKSGASYKDDQPVSAGS